MAEEEPPADEEKSTFDLSAVERTLREAIGVTISELQQDLAERLKDPLLGFEIRMDLKFKAAKRKFKEDYIRAVLQRNFGNISEAARILDLSRRTVHRLSEDVEVAQIRGDMASPRYFKQQDISSAISEVLQEYGGVLHPKRMETVYRKVPVLSADLLEVVEQKPLPLKDALEEFERRYLTRALARHGPGLRAVGRAIGLRYETLLRKLKALGVGVRE